LAKKVTQSLKDLQPAAKTFPVIAIGASAGGIEAISLLFEAMPAKLGFAYVVIQHLSPNHESILPELIERKTRMKVYLVTDGMAVKENVIFVIPPNTFMSIADGHLKLSPRSVTGHGTHSIDFFLSALAPIYKEKAVAVILSGTANDGTEGVKAIKNAGGITFAQDNSAKFLGMPHNAVDSGFIDNVLSPQGIAAELEKMSRLRVFERTPETIIDTKQKELQFIFSLLNNKFNIDFSAYKANTIVRRIVRRMNLHKINNAADYITLLKTNPDEPELLYQDLLINVTSFFREPELFNSFTTTIFPELLKNRHSTDTLRIWIPACSSGEEACSVAITLFEFLGTKALTTPLHIFATDLSESAIKKARAGIYPSHITQQVSPKMLAKYFIKTDGSYQVIKAIRDVCIYATHNLLSDPPFSRMDIISCQNVMIYLDAAAQQKILQSFHYSLKPNGYLVLGKSEGVSNGADLFIQSQKGQRIFKKTSNPSNLKFEFASKLLGNTAGIIPGNKMSGELVNESDLGKEIDKILLSQFMPASVLINKDLHIVRFNGDTSNYLQPASGKASLNVLKMVKDEIVFELRSLLNKVKKNDVSVKKDNIPLTINAIPGLVSIEVIPIKTTADYYLLVFKDKAVVPANITKGKAVDANGIIMQNRITQLEFYLKESKEHLKMMTEEFNTIQEQLQTANEEVLSSNEELQSINEELETSKEELQSTNEELTTINEELQRRNDELSISVNYAESIVETMREPLLVLNADMKIEKANRAFLHLFGLQHETVIRNNLFEVADGKLDIKVLRDKLKKIISASKSFENFEVQEDIVNGSGKTLLFNALRITDDDKIKNKYLLVIEDISDRKQSEKLLKTNEERLRLIIQNAFDIITIFSEKGDVIYESESIKHILGYEPHERMGKNIFTDSIVHPDDRVLKENMFKKALRYPGKDIKSEFRLINKDGSYRVMEAVCINLLDDFKIKGVVANYHDVTERRMLEKQKDQFIGIASHELKTPVTSIKGYAQLLEQIFDGDNNGEAVSMIKKMNSQINRLSALIKDLLDVTQIEEGVLKIKPEQFDINQLINEVISEIQPTSKHRILTELQSDPAYLTTDKEKIRQVIVNLISNAIKYSPDADEILVRTVTDKTGIIISVKDYGIGIPEEIQSKIFDRFFREKDPSINTYPGLGLGLYIAAEIMKRLQGKIWVKSTKGKGSDFFISLPVTNG
jgi:two-component system CheB/CheR fusion protein